MERTDVTISGDRELETNKRLAREFIDAICRWDWDGVGARMTDDAIYRVAGTTAVSGTTRSRDDYVAQCRRLFGDMTEPMVMEYGEAIAEADRVSLIGASRLRLPDGRLYANDYHFFIRLRKGLVAEVREYMDTQHVASLFG